MSSENLDRKEFLKLAAVALGITSCAGDPTLRSILKTTLPTDIGPTATDSPTPKSLLETETVPTEQVETIEETPQVIEAVDLKEVEKIQNNIEAFMNVPQEDMENYIETYGWRISIPGDSEKHVAPELYIVGDRSIPNQNNYPFTFENITPNLGILTNPQLSDYEPATRIVQLQGIYLGKIAVKDVYGLDRNFIIVGHDIGGRRFVNTVYTSAFTPKEDLLTDNMMIQEVKLPPNNSNQQRGFASADARIGQSSKVLPTLEGKEGRITQYLVVSGPGLHANVDLWGSQPDQLTETDLQLLHPEDDPKYDIFIREIASIINPDKRDASIFATLQAQRLHETVIAMYVEDGKHLGLSFNVPGVDLNLIGNNPDQEILAELSFDSLVNIAKKGLLTGMDPWEFTTGSGWKILQDEPLFKLR